MAAGTWLFTNYSKARLLDGTIEGSDTFLISLHTTTGTGPSATTEHYTDITTSEHANQSGDGYLTGGHACTIAVSVIDTDDAKWDETSDTVQWTATGANITAKWAVIYDSTDANKHIVCYCLLDSGGADVTATTGNTFTITANASGIFTLV